MFVRGAYGGISVYPQIAQTFFPAKTIKDRVGWSGCYVTRMHLIADNSVNE